MSDNCHVEPIQKSALDHVIQSADRILLSISGMGCPNCATRVRNRLLLLDGVHDAEVLLNTHMAEVYFDEKKVCVEMLVEAVADAGNDGRHNYQAQAITS
ncbi:MAG: heavy metal-associated domain-containing protein [Chloroflexota bacterium]